MTMQTSEIVQKARKVYAIFIKTEYDIGAIHKDIINMKMFLADVPDRNRKKQFRDWRHSRECRKE